MQRVATKLGLLCFLLATLVSFALGLVYLLTPEFMPYHQEALGVPWEQLEPPFQVLFLALLRVAGGGFVATALAMGILLAKPYREGARWAPAALLGVGLTMLLPTGYAVFLVKTRTPGSPPWGMLFVVLALLLVGFAASLRVRSAGARLRPPQPPAKSAARPVGRPMRPTH